MQAENQIIINYVENTTNNSIKIVTTEELLKNYPKLFKEIKKCDSNIVKIKNVFIPKIAIDDLNNGTLVISDITIENLNYFADIGLSDNILSSIAKNETKKIEDQNDQNDQKQELKKFIQAYWTHIGKSTGYIDDEQQKQIENMEFDKIEKMLTNNISRLEELPESISLLNNVKFLSLKNNLLKELPKSFTELKNLEILDIGCNCFEKCPEQLLELPNLDILRCYGSMFGFEDETIKKLMIQRGVYIAFY